MKKTETQKTYRMIRSSHQIIDSAVDKAINSSAFFKPGQVTHLSLTLIRAEERIRALSKERQEAYADLKQKLEVHKNIKRLGWLLVGVVIGELIYVFDAWGVFQRMFK